MDHNTGLILHQEYADSKLFGNHSPKMEPVLFRKGLTVLLQKIQIKEVVTDASKALMSIMCENPLHIIGFINGLVFVLLNLEPQKITLCHF